jgi:hypothetical protein
MNVKAVQMLVTPGKHDLQERMQGRKGHSTPDKHPAPDEWTDAPEDEAELVDAERCSRGCHALRVAQRSVPLKISPRYLTLSSTPGLSSNGAERSAKLSSFVDSSR